MFGLVPEMPVFVVVRCFLRWLHCCSGCEMFPEMYTLGAFPLSCYVCPISLFMYTIEHVCECWSVGSAMLVLLCCGCECWNVASCICLPTCVVESLGYPLPSAFLGFWVTTWVEKPKPDAETIELGRGKSTLYFSVVYQIELCEA